jgi:hypothetical protein
MLNKKNISVGGDFTAIAGEKWLNSQREKFAASYARELKRQRDQLREKRNQKRTETAFTFASLYAQDAKHEARKRTVIRIVSRLKGAA